MRFFIAIPRNVSGSNSVIAVSLAPVDSADINPPAACRFWQNL